jgi:hypothetical protein
LKELFVSVVPLIMIAGGAYGTDRLTSSNGIYNEDYLSFGCKLSGFGTGMGGF